ncbi:MAG: hypothetical protein MI674_04865, partial [Cytophagales bacterium]|nr:hypothetical protein [Cytophagales bacterium]
GRSLNQLLTSRRMREPEHNHKEITKCPEARTQRFSSNGLASLTTRSHTMQVGRGQQWRPPSFK